MSWLPIVWVGDEAGDALEAPSPYLRASLFGLACAEAWCAPCADAWTSAPLSYRVCAGVWIIDESCSFLKEMMIRRDQGCWVVPQTRARNSVKHPPLNV